MEGIGDRGQMTPANVKNKIKIFLDLIKFEHTIFALPFAYLGMLLASPDHFSFKVFFWVTVAMASARTAAMLLNRLIDKQIDAKNPRTQNRATVTGEFSSGAALIGIAISLVIFFMSAFLLNPLCFKLSFVAIVLLTGYHYVKRFSFLCHYALGLVLASAPMGGWIAVTGRFDVLPVFLSLAVLFWVAGFDILYSLQDIDFDRAHGLYSIPVKFGQGSALAISRYSHLTMVFFLAVFGLFAKLGILYWSGVAVCGIFLAIEHLFIADGDLTHINTAFFTINGWVGILLLVFTFLEVFK